MRRRLNEAIVFVAGVAMLAVPAVVTDRYVLKVLTFVGLNTIVVIGLALLFGYAGQVSLGHAAFFGIGAYTSARLVMSFGLPWVLSVVGAAVVAALAGWAVAVPGLRLRGHYLAMATLGFNEIMSVAFVEARPVTGGNDGLGGVPFPSFGSFELKTPSALFVLVWAVALLVWLAARNIVRSRPGRAMRALHCTEPGALASGVDVAAVKVRVFALSAGLAGLAGALFAHSVGFISPSSFGLDLSVLLVAAVVLGGRESLSGPIVAMAVLTLLQYLGALLPGLPRQAAEAIQDWVPDIVGATLIAVLIARARGGAPVRAKEALGRGAR
ncbi:MAG: branched-chain amino acid ABC transporter permease [Coriobacteriia bacterium]|nr:branched-chain amino acid ABC transporter permease [Coriobacteriia bacterium]